ncbi:MAG: DUF4156 domain-containing protein [Spirochaetia bacterium]|nr:DUF4156 domain-containing protein [Spirochaetia bacterium]
MKRIGLSAIVFALSTCATLTPGGQAVKYATKTEPDAACKQLQETVSSSFNASQESLINSLRNDVAAKGGNFLVIDTMLAVSANGSMRYEGTGRGFVCP